MIQPAGFGQLQPTVPAAPAGDSARPPAAGVTRDYYHPKAPWPAMRGSADNSGCTRLLRSNKVPRLDVPIRIWRTDNAVFSTPIIGPDEMIYVGSADKNFYALSAVTGALAWKFTTSECIDSAACIDKDGIIYVPSCDARIYALDMHGKLKWKFDALKTKVGFSPSTIYWWEGNLALGPSGLLYGGNDNFYLYALERRGVVRWVKPTGLNIWSAPAFTQDYLFGASFDMHVFCLDVGNGSTKWRTNSGNLVAASPALTDDGKVVVGNLGGTLTALRADDGHVMWRAQTGGHIYASAAVAPDGNIYVGSADGLMYCFDAHGAPIFTFDTGDAIRASAAIGPDPEGLQPYLIYFGSGNGHVYALQPDGTRRWSYDTKIWAPTGQYGNINASVALGKYGLSTATAGGDVLYFPYYAYLNQPGFCRDPQDAAADGVVMHVLAPGGGVMAPQAGPLPLLGAQTLSLRLVVRENGRRVPSQIDPNTVIVRSEPALPWKYSITPDRQQINVEPLDLLSPGETYEVFVNAQSRRTFTTASQAQVANVIAQRLLVCSQPVTDPPSPAELEELPLQLTHLSIYEPNIVPSFDQIGLSSLSLDLQVVHHDPTSSAVVAWGVLPFGSDATGAAVGVPRQRNLFFAFNGMYRDGHLLLDSLHPWFEITAMPIPLDRLHITAAVPAVGTCAEGGSVIAEVRVPSRLSLMREMLWKRNSPAWKALTGSSGKVSGGRQGRGSWRHSSAALARSFAWMWNLFWGHAARAWGLLDADNTFRGLGTFRLTAVQRPVESPVAVNAFYYDRPQRHVVARLTPEKGSQPVMGVMLLDLLSAAAVPIDYNSCLHHESLSDGTLRVKLCLPRGLLKSGRQYRALLMHRSQVLQQIDF